VVLLRKTRKTAAGLGAPPKASASSSSAGRRAATPFALLRSTRKTAALLAFAVLVLATPACAESVTELKVKAAFLYNFTKFVKWPANAFSSPSEPLTICMLGDDELREAVSEAIRDKSIDAHPLVLRRFKPGADTKGCQVLFVSGEDLPKTSSTLLSSPHPGILTVSEVPDLQDRYAHGAIITFVPDSNRIRFSISNKTAEKVGIEISSKLLNLAISVEQ
jgi:YfiR/HmsC-like